MVNNTFDKRLLAIGNCPIMEINDPKEKYSGNIVFNPSPVINATNNEVLAHELCHLLAGKKDYDIFKTAIIARDNNSRFAWLLNALYDWYHEIQGKEHSVIISNYLLSLRNSQKIDDQKDKEINKILYLLNNEVSLEEGCKLLDYNVRDTVDLIVLADRYYNSIKVETKKLIELLSKTRTGTYLTNHKGPYSDYYTRTVSKYYETIKTLSRLWMRNKHNWDKSYFGEINWKNLPLLMLGNKINLPVFRLWKKILMSRSVFVAIDRSGSTYYTKDTIMDISIIITESLVMSGTPVSILDVGVEDKVINDIDKPIVHKWFTPINDGNTPLGEVCQKIKGDDHDSFLLIITDGQPDSWEDLKCALNKFKGNYLTCVIGNSYREYASTIGNTIQVEPHTIIREILSNENLIVCENQ